jgi:hypothetical protein
MAGDIIREATAHPDVRLKYKGVCDYEKLSTMIIRWLLDREYKINEEKHKHKMSCPHGFEIERDIEAWKKIDDYFMHKLEVRFHTYDSHEVEAVRNGKKVKLWDGRMEIQLGFDIVCDYAGKWEKNQFIEKLRNFYDQYIIKREIIIKHADPVHYEVLRLHTEIKKFLAMETGTLFDTKV